jgi:hypothetical protein
MPFAEPPTGPTGDGEQTAESPQTRPTGGERSLGGMTVRQIDGRPEALGTPARPAPSQRRPLRPRRVKRPGLWPLRRRTGEPPPQQCRRRL